MRGTAASSLSPSMRSTQRAPRSCVPCSARKVKCDKAEPCGTCIRRGDSSRCVRETVLIRGEPKTWRNGQSIFLDADSSSRPTTLASTPDRINESVQSGSSDCDDRSLTVEASHSSAPPASNPSSLSLHHLSPAVQRPEKPQHVDHPHKNCYGDPLEDVLWNSMSSVNTTISSSVTRWADIFLPSRSIGMHLIAYDRTWNSWVHYALEYPRFQHESEDFMDAMESGRQLDQYDPFWMAVYFSMLCAALLMMDDDEASRLLSSQSISMDVTTLCRNWFDSAIFCLHQADFMRVSHICTVQTIAILGMCFNILGESDLCQHMWSIAIRVAQRMHLDTPNSTRAGGMKPEAQYRLWWTLVICEWLNVSHESAQITRQDFDVPLPCPRDTLRTDRLVYIDPAHYHVFMARISTVYHDFRESLRLRTITNHDLGAVVRAADEALALVIDTLPEHLQPELGAQRTVRELEESQPWIKWQRFDITLVLLHHRVRINRTLQQHWLTSPGEYAWAQAVCIRSSLDIIWISRNWDQPVSMRKQWALSFHLFVAAIVLLRELSNAKSSERQKYREAIDAGIHILEQVQSQNEIARHAVRVLRHHLDYPS